MSVKSILVALGLIATTGAHAQDDVVSRAMRDELARTMSTLRLKQLDRPYFVSYEVSENSTVRTSASYGSLMGTDVTHGERRLFVEVRVGDYAFDNTNAIAMGRFGGFGVSMRSLEQFNLLPRDDNYKEIRRQIWLATDAAYKEALEALAAKHAALMNRTQTKPLPDFTHEPATHTHETLPETPVDRAPVEDLARALSRVATSPTIYTSRVTIGFTNDRERYVNSEGTEYVVDNPLAIVSARATTQASTGMRLADGVEWYVRRLDSLPPHDQMIARIRGMVARLDSLRTAPAFERYNGPVIFEGPAAAEIFEADFAGALVGHRPMFIDNPQAEAMMSQMRGGSFADKLGGRVLPDFMRVVDDPTATTAGGVSLLGRYTVDDEGVRARPTVLVDSGVLKTLLSTRSPVDGVDHSTGSRRGWGAMPSNLVVSATNGVTESALVEQMMALVKRRGLAYGIIVRAIGETGAGADVAEMMSLMADMSAARRTRGLLATYRVYPDGRQELVRRAFLTDFASSAFKDIVSASNMPTVRTTAGFGGGPTGFSMMMPEFGFAGTMLDNPVSIAVPSLLFDDVSLTAGQGTVPRPPISAPPT